MRAMRERRAQERAREEETHTLGTDRAPQAVMKTLQVFELFLPVRSSLMLTVHRPFNADQVASRTDVSNTMLLTLKSRCTPLRSAYQSQGGGSRRRARTNSA